MVMAFSVAVGEVRKKGQTGAFRMRPIMREVHTMNARWLTIISDCLVLIGLIVLGSGWQGTANLTGAFPFHSSSVSFNGSANGVHALLGVPSLVIGLLLMIASLVWSAVEAMQQ
jgi:hypothetical protein